MINLPLLKSILEVEYSDIIVQINLTQINEARLILIDDSFIEIWYSLELQNRFSIHWERKYIDGTIYRHDNIPHKKWINVTTFPQHFHNGSEESVEESSIHENIEIGVLQFLKFVRDKIYEF